MNDLFKHLAPIGATLIVVAASLSVSTFAQVQPNPTPTPCPDTATDYPQCPKASRDEQKEEQYVRDQLLDGLPVELTKGSVIRGCFVRGLLTKKLGVPHSGITIEGATIRGPVDLQNEEITVRVALINCTFLDDFNMKRSHFSKGLSFAGSSFAPGRLDAESAIIDFDLTLDNCTFQNCLTFLKSLKVGVDLSMRGSKFRGDVDLTGSVIGSNLLADKNDPNDPNEPKAEFSSADFEGIKVGLDANLTDVVFHGPASFNNATFNNLGLERSTFEGDASFKSTQIDDFYLGENPAGRFKGTLMIEDLAFKYMSPEDLDQLRDFAEKSNSTPQQVKYNSQLYSTLEGILRRHGHDDWGDEVYIAGKRKEREYLPWYAKASGYFLDWFIGYGRHVGRLLWWSAFFIAFGCYAFWSKNNMELKKPDGAPASTKNYCPFLYALDLFIPIVGLGYADIWTPSRPLGKIYKPVHAIVGHLFVPIGLAAWTGIIK